MHDIEYDIVNIQRYTNILIYARLGLTTVTAISSIAVNARSVVNNIASQSDLKMESQC